MILLILSFVAGVLTVLAPCVLPLLPVIVGGSLSGAADRKKAVTISASLGLSVILFTFILKASTAAISIPQETWSYVSGGIIVLFGLASLFPGAWERIPGMARLAGRSNGLLGAGYRKKSFWGDVIIGASLGPVFSTCSPTYFVILATVLPQSFLLGTIDLLAYAAGLSIMLLLIAFLGQKIVGRLGGISDTHGIFRRSLGGLFILLGIAIVFGADRKFEAYLLDGRIFDITRVEQKLLSLNSSQPGGTPSLTGADIRTAAATTSPLFQASHGPKAPELADPSGFINTDGKPITLSQFKGKNVVLLDVWTYSCINCQRTLPYVIEWSKKYKDKGLVVIGLHTPEFAFEKVQKNVEDAVKRLGIPYPVVMDNDYATWNAYGNQYWPRKYLINENGEIIYDHIGEGNYDETELAIQDALSELNKSKVSDPVNVPAGAISFDPAQVQSPETYFGASRNGYLANGAQGSVGVQTLSVPARIESNALYLGGRWNFAPEYAATAGPAKIIFTYSAKNVYMVASAGVPVEVTILKDGVKQKSATIGENRLYTIIEGDSYGTHTLEIDVPSGGLQAFTFTFG
jgi:cytochrome c biogenesis protein CcdA/thiol-disulfide isomerase/thioredoxin